MSNPAQKRPRLGIFGKSAEAPPVRIIKPNAVPAAALSLTNLVAQVLPESIMKSARRVRYIVNITSNADLGPLKSFRTDGKAPGPPFSFAYPTISSSDERRFASKFGFIGFTELQIPCPDTGAFGELLTHAPSFKLFGTSLYPESEDERLVLKEMNFSTVSIGTEWERLELAKVGLVTNTEAFFASPRFKEAIQMAAVDSTFRAPSGQKFWDLLKSRQHGLQCIDSPATRDYASYLSRFVIVTNPPPDSKFGAHITSVQGGTTTDRGTTRPFKITMAQAGKPTALMTVTMWPSDAKVILGESDDMAERLKSAHLVLMITGSASDNDEGVEYVVRAVSLAVNTADFLSFKSDVFKSLFNDTVHDASLTGQSKMSYEMSLKATLDEGRPVAISGYRVSDADDLLLHKEALKNFVREFAKAQPAVDEDTVAMVDLVLAAPDKLLLDAIEALDNSAAKVESLDAAREKMIQLLEDGDDTDLIKMAIVVMSAFERMDKSQALKMQPMIKRSEASTAEVEAPVTVESDDEDLCAGL